MKNIGVSFSYISDTEELNPDKLTLDSFEPRTKEDFTKYAKMLQDKFTTLENSPHYFYLMETFLSSAIVKCKLTVCI